MHRRTLTGCSALVLAMSAWGSTPADACDWRGSGYGYYGASAYAYAPPAYGYYAPSAYYAPPPCACAPSGYGYAYNQPDNDEYYGYAAAPYYGGRGGYIASGYRGGYGPAAYYRGPVYGGRVGRVGWRR